MKKKGFIITLASPSGGGKSSILCSVLGLLPQAKYSISYTTRQIRGTEQDGIDYFFISEQEFLKKKEEGFFLEYAHVHNYWYGTAKDYVLNILDQGNHVIMDIDVQGVAQVKELGYDVVSIFVLPPDFETLKQRLIDRKTDSNEQIEQRLINSKKEIDQLIAYDYLVINNSLDKAIECVVNIILAEENRVIRYIDPIKTFYN
ncbi:MAG TPA: guanylate kinase [Candidatus Cloacimonadota bacterium]|nr:guanylate kinase [Candidatus Cloacimonadota bacterium]HQB41418.1 guanylate kinase [Candidatus Cloacimonadota bacterium]